MDEIKWRNLYIKGDNVIREQIKNYKIKAVEVCGSLFVLSSQSRYDYILDDYDERTGVKHGISRFTS